MLHAAFYMLRQRLQALWVFDDVAAPPRNGRENLVTLLLHGLWMLLLVLLQ